MTDNLTAQTITPEIRQLIRAQARRTNSKAAVIDAIHAVLSESNIRPDRLSLDEWKDIVRDATCAAHPPEQKPKSRRAA